MIITQEYRHALSLDRAAYPLWKKSFDARVCELLNSDPNVQHLKSCATLIKQEALKRLENGHSLRHVQQAIIEPMVERFLNNRAVSLDTPNPTKISFLIQDLGGNGDLIFGVRAFRALSHYFPKTSFHMVTSGVDKLKKVLHHASLNCPISKIERIGTQPSFSVEAQDSLENSDVVFVSPTGCWFVPPKVKQNKKDITLLEYNRPDYGLDIGRRMYVTGIGDQACGIFIDQTNEITTRADSLAALDNRPLSALLHTLDPQNNQSLYFGYGHNDVERFLSVLVNYETGNGIILTSHFDKKKLLLPSNTTVILHNEARFLDVLEAFQKQGVPIDIAKALQFRQEREVLLKECNHFETSWIQEQIQRVDEIIAEAQRSLPSGNAKSFVESLENGFCEIGGKWITSEVLTKAPLGNTIHIVTFHGLSFDDTRRIKNISDEVCLSTGDQSFSEDISLQKLMMYDTRKIEPIEALAAVANQEGLSLIARYFTAFARGNISQTISCLRKRDQLRKEANTLYKKVHKEMSLTPQLIGLVKRQMRGQLDAHRIHESFVSYVLDPRDATLINTQAAILEHETSR